MVDGPGEYVVVDMTAGAHSFASGLFTRFDLTFLVCEPTVRSVGVYRQYVGYSRDHRVRVAVGQRPRRGGPDRPDRTGLHPGAGDRRRALNTASEKECMSLNVPAALLQRAQASPADDAEFVACVRDSLPYAWQVISGAVADLHAGGGDFAEHSVPPPSEAERGQLLRALAATRSAAAWSGTSG